MRQIGHLQSDRDARTFGDYLYVKGIANEAERDGESWAIWVHSDDQIAEAKQLLDEFRKNPIDARFLAGSPAEKLRKQEEKEQDAYRKRVVDARKMFPGLRSYGFGPVTYGLIFGSVVVFVLSHMGNDFNRVLVLFISEVQRGLPELRQGQIWRVVTPILIHFGFMHILFNMMWLKDLGSMFEARLGSLYFAAFIVVVAAASNLAQFYYKGPAFGGMSGVVYALIGYIWMRGRFDPTCGLFLDRQSIILALVWFVLCFIPQLMGPVANACHGVGLLAGVVWGFVDAKRK